MLDGIRVKLDMWQIFLHIIVSLTGPRFLHYEPYFSNLNGFETTANEFNKQNLVSHWEHHELAKHDPKCLWISWIELSTNFKGGILKHNLWWKPLENPIMGYKFQNLAPKFEVLVNLWRLDRFGEIYGQSRMGWNLQKRRVAPSQGKPTLAGSLSSYFQCLL